ncbi:MAG TPA: transposase [Chloroflexota bacterium]|nr:transposase [Chloroflexota bacterium]
MIPFTVPEVRRLLLALAEPPERFSFRLHWSRWRRQHQARAKRAHMARRAQRLVALPVIRSVVIVLPPARNPHLTEDQWQRLHSLLPPRRSPRGRPPHDHRRMVEAMLWVERTGCSWRSLPSHFGPWQGVYSRYQRWRGTGLWAQILATLDHAEVLPDAA